MRTGGTLPTPVLKWVGGKRGLLDELISAMPEEYGAYYEPFVGGGALMMSVAPSLDGHSTHISDLNGDLIDVYTAIRDDPDAVMTHLDALIADYSEAQYYAVRASLRNGPVAQRAARFIYLNKTGYNGLVRYNRRGAYNVPWGHKKSLTTSMVYDRENVLALSELLHDVDVRCQGYQDCHPDTGDFVYLDPPYASTFSTYNAGGFGEKEQRELADWCGRLDDMGVRFMLSNSDVPLVHELYGSRFDVRLVLAPRAVSCKGEGRKPVHEVLVTNYERTE